MRNPRIFAPITRHANVPYVWQHFLFKYLTASSGFCGSALSISIGAVNKELLPRMCESFHLKFVLFLSDSKHNGFGQQVLLRIFYIKY